MLPWTGGIEGLENGTLVFAILAAVLYLLRPAQAGGIKWAAIKTVPVVLFAVIALRLQAPWLLVAGFGFSAFGDFCLAFDGEKPFLGGLSAFFAAHIAFIALFVTRGGDMIWLDEPSRLVLGAVLIVHSLLMARRLAGAVPAALKYPVFAYIGVITLMGLAAAAYGSSIVLAGALFFALSDTLLAIRNFILADNDPRRSLTDGGVWVTYIVAQALILFGFPA